MLSPPKNLRRLASRFQYLISNSEASCAPITYDFNKGGIVEYFNISISLPPNLFFRILNE